MKNLKIIHVFMLLIAVLFFSACTPKPATVPVTYKTISDGTVKAGNVIPAPTGDVVLTLDGKISQKNAGETLQFDMATLESVRVVEYKVDDPFIKKNILYSGVLLSDLLEIAGADKTATTLKLWALDDYSVEMKMADAMKWPIIVATKADGVYISAAQNGPLISVFPFNDFPEIDHLTYDNQWLWALAKITVK